MNFADRAIPELYDPVFGSNSSSEMRINKLLHSGLYGKDKLGTVTYILAESFPLYSDNDRVLEIDLRDDINWSDGRKITADDVVYSWKVLKAMKYSGKKHLKKIESINPVPGNSNQLIITLLPEYADPQFHKYLVFPLLPRHIIGSYSYTEHDEYASMPVTIGRYTLKDVESSHITLEALYWPADKPNSERVREIKLSALPDLNAIWMFFSSLNTNFIMDIPASNKNSVKARPETFGFRDYAANKWAGIILNNKHKLLSHVEARKAFTLLFSRRRAVNRFGGKANLITGPFTTGSSFYDIDIPEYPNNPEEAKRLFSTLGCTWNKDGKMIYEGEQVRLRFVKSQALSNNEMDVVINDYITKLRDIGINIDVLGMSNLKLYRDKIQNKKDEYEMALVSLTYPSDTAIKEIFHSKGRSNFCQYSDGKTDKYLDELLSGGVDPAIAVQLGKQIHQRIHETLPMVFLWEYNYTAGWNRKQLDLVSIDPLTIFNSVTTWKVNVR
ncbi:MAG: ABC transporter substrate-binding protein [Bacteroidetes bacterium]|nr:ABC transporter substrate-binding protein [Bacteroidota bacterium]